VSSQNDFVWLDDDVVRAIHEAQIAEHGGSLGVRDPGLLASALNRPRNAAAHGEPDVAELAALYALGVIKNHPLVDGNKRVGAVLLELFLDMNGYDLVANDEELLPTILNAAAGDANEELIDWIRENVVRRRKR
jgi:death-on-curing protein